MYKLLSGAKSVKQYRGDENLPEAKKGMKRTYKYQDGNRTALIKSLEKKHLGDVYETEKNKEGMDLPGRDYWEMKFRKQLNTSDAAELYENIIKKQQLMGVKDRIYKSPNPLISPDQRDNIEPPMPPSNINPKTLNVDKKISDQQAFGISEGMYNKKGSKSLKSCGCKHSKSKYKYQNGSNNLPSDDKYINYLSLLKDRLSKNSETPNYYDYILDRYMSQYNSPITLDASLSKVKNPYLKKEKEITEDKENKEERQEEIRGDRNNDIRRRRTIIKNRRDAGLHSTVRKRSFWYKYNEGSGALTIPEGSAIVTANGGKNKQALAAYKQGNYKLLNKIIDDMPEDKVSKNQSGNRRVKDINALDYVPAGQHASGKYYGSADDAALDELKKNNPWYNWDNFDPSRRTRKDRRGNIIELGDVEKFQKAFNEFAGKNNSNKRLTIDDKLGDQTKTAKVDYIEDPITTTTGGGGGNNNTGGNTGGNTTTTTTTKIPEDEYEEINAGEIKVPNPRMSFAETSAIGNVLGQGIQRPRESYLKLDRYNYASQLPKTLQEISLAEQGGRETARDIVGGDAGRYLAQTGNLSSARMKAANEAVIADTLARQDILNKNVDISNTELTTNRSLKDYYDDIKRQNVNDYNALLVKGGQSIDEGFDAYQKMKNENLLKAQELQLLQESNPNYTMVQDPKTGLMRSVYRFQKKPGSTTQTNPQVSNPQASLHHNLNVLNDDNFSPNLGRMNMNKGTFDKKNGLKKAKIYKRK
jgi:hypothetical protein